MAKREMKTTVDEPKTGDVQVGSETKVSTPYVITGCTKLNVRKKPNVKAEVVCVVDKNTELTVEQFDASKDWVKVCTDKGVKGYCMKKYITNK